MLKGTDFAESQTSGVCTIPSPVSEPRFLEGMTVDGCLLADPALSETTFPCLFLSFPRPVLKTSRIKILLEKNREKPRAHHSVQGIEPDAVVVIQSISMDLLGLAQSFNHLINRLETKTCLQRVKTFMFS